MPDFAFARGACFALTLASSPVAEAVGGCSDGPEVVDLEKRIYWTC